MKQQGPLSATRLAAGLLVAASCLFAADADAQTTPTLSINSPAVNEGDSGSTTMTFTVTLSATSASAVTVAYADAGTGTATSGTDYTAITAGTLTFAAGTTSQTIAVSVIGDTTHEPNESVVVRLSSPTNAGFAGGATTLDGTGWIRDDEPQLLSISSPTVNEGDSGSTDMTFTVSRTVALATPLRVVFEITGGTATAGVDYTAPTLTNNRVRLSFLRNQRSKTVTISVQGDTDDEEDETVEVGLSGLPFGWTGGTGTGTIRDDDGPLLLRFAGESVLEGNSGSTTLTFTATLLAPGNAMAISARPVTMNYADSGTGTATSGTDYTALTAGTLTIAPGDSSATITVSVQGDTETERDETIVVSLSNLRNARFVTAFGNSATGTIRNDDSFPVADAGPDQPMVTEGATVTLSGSGYDPDGSPITSYRWDQTAGPSVTLMDRNAATTTFTAPSGLTLDETLRFSLTVVADGEAGSDSVDISVDATTDSWTVEAGPDQTVDEDTTVTLSGTGPTVQGVRPPTFFWRQTGTLPPAGRGVVTFTGGNTATPSFTAPNLLTDFTLMFQMIVTVGNDQRTDTVSVTVEADNDPPDADAGADGFAFQDRPVSLSGLGSSDPENEALSYSWTQTGGDPTVSLTGATTATPSFTSPMGLTGDIVLTFELTVTAGGATDTDTVDVFVFSGPAFSSEELVPDAGPDQTVVEGDAVALDGTASVVPPGHTGRYSWRQTGGPMVALIGEETTTPRFTAPNVRSDVTLTFELMLWAAGVSNTDTVDVTVQPTPTDSDTTPTPTTPDPLVLTANAGADQTVFEGDVVRLSGESDSDGESLSYSWRQTGGRPTVTLTGATTATPSFTAPNVTSDVTLTFTLTVTTGEISATDTVDVTITAYPTLSIDSPSVAEGDGGSTSLTFTVSLNAASSRQVTVAYATADGTASAGSDYQAASGELQFAPGETELTVSVPVLGDTRPERNETITLTLSSPVNAELVEPQATGVIVNDDTAMASVADARVEEGDSGMAEIDFRVTLSVAGDLEVTVAYATADGTASAESDYRATSGELLFAPGETELTVSVPVLGDARPERDETFTLTLSDPVNVELARAEATGVIVNDDLAVASIADARVEEGDSGMAEADFRVTLSVAGDLEVTVAYATADGTASAESDYRATSGELQFAPGETELTVSVPVLGDIRPERDETFTLMLSSPVNAELARAQATGVIVNDDTASASIADARMEEGDSGVTDFGFSVVLSVAGDLEVTVAYATADGTASVGSDYQAASGELRFAPGETELTVSVPVRGDTTPEADETFTVTLSSPRNAELGRTTAATGTIVDDDVANARARALEASLAGFGRTLTWDAMGAISGRFKETPAARSSQVVLGGSPVGQRGQQGQQGFLFADQFAPWQHDAAELDPRDPWRTRLSLGDFLQRSSFHLALNEGGDGENEGYNLSLWGRVSSGRFSGQPLDGLSSRGEVVTGYLGMDAKVGEHLLAGVALAHSNGDVGYGIADFAGELDMSLTSVLPYVNYQLNEKLAIWSMVGIGWGEGSYRDAVRQGRVESKAARGTLDLALRMAAFGANRTLATWRNVDLELKSDAFVMSMAGEPGSGDAQTGVGTEVGGGLDYRHADLGLGVVLQGQYLLFHKAQSFEEKGASLTLEFDPGVQGRGFSLALRPAWGGYSHSYSGGSGGAAALWNNEALLHAGAEPHTASERLDLEWGYGFGLRGDTGLLKLRGALSQQGMGQRRYRFGGLLNRPGKTRSSVELSRQEGLAKPSHGVLIELEHRW